MPTSRANAVLKIGAIDKVSRVVSKIKNKFGPLNRALDKTARKFKVIQLSTQKMRRSLNKFGKSARNAGRRMTVGLSAPIALAGAGIVKTAVNFEASMNRVGALSRTIVKGQVSKQFDGLRDKAKELGATTAFSASEVADGMGFLAQAGFKANDIMKAISPTLDLAAASNTDLAQTADIASNIMGGFNIKAEEMTRVADVLSLVTATSNTNLEQLGEAMQDAAPLAQKFGASLETTAAMAGLLGNIGIQGSKAGTTLKNMFTKLVKPSAKANAVLKNLGVNVADSGGKIRKTEDILQDFANSLKSQSQQVQLAAVSEVFGLRAVAGATDLLAKQMAEGKNPIGDFVTSLQGADGTAKDMANTLLRGAPGAFKKFTSALEGMAIAIAESGLLDTITNMALGFADIFRKIGNLSPTLLKMITLFGVLLAVGGPFLIFLGFMASAISSLVTVYGLITAAGGLAAISTTALGVAFNFLFSPITLIIGAILILIGLAYLLISNWGAVKDFFVGLWDSALAGLMSFYDKAVGVVGKIKSFFGFGNGKLEADVNVNDKTGQGIQAQGTPVGAKKVQQSVINRDFQSRTNNARVDVNVKGPEGTKAVGTADDLGFFNLNLGKAGI